MGLVLKSSEIHSVGVLYINCYLVSPIALSSANHWCRLSAPAVSSRTFASQIIEPLPATNAPLHPDSFVKATACTYEFAQHIMIYDAKFKPTCLYIYRIFGGHAIQLETMWLKPSPQGAEANKLKFQRRVASCFGQCRRQTLKVSKIENGSIIEKAR